MSASARSTKPTSPVKTKSTFQECTKLRDARIVRVSSISRSTWYEESQNRVTEIPFTLTQNCIHVRRLLQDVSAAMNFPMKSMPVKPVAVKSEPVAKPMAVKSKPATPSFPIANAGVDEDAPIWATCFQDSQLTIKL